MILTARPRLASAHLACFTCSFACSASTPFPPLTTSAPELTCRQTSSLCPARPSLMCYTSVPSLELRWGTGCLTLCPFVLLARETALTSIEQERAPSFVVLSGGGPAGVGLQERITPFVLLLLFFTLQAVRQHPPQEQQRSAASPVATEPNRFPFSFLLLRTEFDQQSVNGSRVNFDCFPPSPCCSSSSPAAPSKS